MSQETVETVLNRIALRSRGDPYFQFTSVFHLMNVEMLRGCFAGLREDAAAGIDHVTKWEYGKHLEENLINLVRRLHQMSYRPQPVKRVYIPKAGSDKLRPLGIPVLEDKLVQAGMVRILEAIYEQEFMDDSYGFRPRRGCHDALRALNLEVHRGGVNYVVEADIRGFFDHVDHDILMYVLGDRLGDKRMLRYIKRFLIAGIMEEGRWYMSEKGTPQGGVVSPILANIYLHYGLDRWFDRVFRHQCNGRARLIRYADDFVVTFQQEGDARLFRQALEKRLSQFGLSLAEEKTKVLEFGPYAVQWAKARGERAETFDFLGFTHYCGRSRDGKGFRMKRKTIMKRFTAKLHLFKEWLKVNRHRPVRELMPIVAKKLRGHYAYYGVTDNSKSIDRFAYEVRKLLFKWLDRRGKRGSMNWDKFKHILSLFPLPIPRIRVNLF
ncbi:MAG: group II intron reverse transcriptase/maturase [Planctomycetes bacterium]|nr:group II intron reverse transcriptase/maturase [Planctomycetota bacterium]